MNDPEPIHVLRRSPGRLRLQAPLLSAGGSKDLARVAAAEGVLDARLSARTGNVLIEFDRTLIDEPGVLALIETRPASRRRSERARRASAEPPAHAQAGWRRAKRAETFQAKAADCVTAVLDFERYPEWQTYLTAVTVLERDDRGRGIRVATQAQVGEREIEFITSYRFPSPNRVLFEQEDGELEAVRGSWAFRSLGRGRTRATCVLEVKPGWRLNLMLRGPLYEQIRDAVLDHLMGEMRARVEGDPHRSPRRSQPRRLLA